MPQILPRPFDCLSAMRALGEPTRLRLMRRLLEGPQSVTELTEALGITTYNTSRHLSVLRNAGLVEVEPVAQQRIYNLAPGCRRRLRDKSHILDLGCCSFDFDKLPE